MMDLVIEKATIVTMDQERTILEDGTIGVKEGSIVHLGGPLKEKTHKRIDASGCVVLPGLINCHTHLYQALIEGIGYDMHFDAWNWRYLFPIVSRIGPEHAAASAELAALEMIKSGTTTVSDHWYLHTDFDNIYRVAEALDRAGLRSQLVYGLLDQTFAGERTDSEYMTMIRKEEDLIAQAREFVKRWHGRNRTRVALGPGSTEDVSEDLLKKTVGLARELGLMVSTHVAGWVEIISYCYRKYGQRDLEYLHSLGLEGSDTTFVHAVWLSPQELNLLSESNSGVVHCPLGNMHLAYGVSPVSQMMARGICVGLGTDGAASCTYDLFEVARTAAFLQKVANLDAESLTAEQALEMATINGAKVLGLDDQVGSLEIGKRADLIIVDFQQPHLLKTARIVPKLVYSARGSDVITTVIDGQVVMEDRRVLTLDEDRVLQRATEMYQDLVKKAGPETRQLLEAPWPKRGSYWSGPGV